MPGVRFIPGDWVLMIDFGSMNPDQSNQHGRPGRSFSIRAQDDCCATLPPDDLRRFFCAVARGRSRASPIDGRLLCRAIGIRADPEYDG